MEMNPRPNYDLTDVFLMMMNFVVKHILGLASITFGVVAKVYMVRKEWRRVSKWECRLSVFFSGLAGSIAYMVLQSSLIDDMYKAIIVGFTPIIVEPVMMRVLIWINPMIDTIFTWAKEFFTKKDGI